MQSYNTPIKAKGGSDEISVATPSMVYDAMFKKWQLPEDLRGGSEAMQAKRQVYLPQEPAESDKAYENRLKKSELYNLYDRTITAITGLAFIKPVVVSNVPEELKYLEFNFDGTGRSITEVAFDLAIDAIHYGVVHMLTDFPPVDEGITNLKQYRDAGYKPYVSHINPTRLIGWRLKESAGVPKLENVRIYETKIVGSVENEWADKEVEYVQVYYDDRTDTYTFDSELGEDYELSATKYRTLGYIPITTAYGNKTGFMQGAPALYNLARMNLAHYQLSSDQRNILHIASVPFMLGTGFEDGELTGGEIGTNRIVVSDNPEARLQYVEHTGRAVAAGRQYIQDIEVQMASLGADLLLSKGVSRMTATARRLDQNESMSTLQLALRSIEQAIERAYEIAGDWLGIDASDVNVSIGDDLSAVNEPNPTNALVALRQTGLLTDEQIIEEAKRQGILSSYFQLSDDRPTLTQGVEEENAAEELVEPSEDIDEDEEQEEKKPSEDEVIMNKLFEYLDKED